jgi:anti-sigma28 factor (negative regulator of flagellin synthesis)
MLVPETASFIRKELATLAQIIAVALDMARLQDEQNLRMQMDEARERIERIRQAIEKG